MIKMANLLPILVALVVFTHFLTLVRSDDNEFAEFDDLGPSETLTNTHESTSKPHVSNSQEFGGSKIPDRLDTNEPKEHNKEPKLDEDDTVDEQEDGDKKSSNKKPDLKLVDAPLPRIYKWESYYIEIAFILALSMYFINLFIGGNKNKMFAQDWYTQNRDFLKQQFALVGGAPIFNDGTSKRNAEEFENLPNLKKQRGLIKVTDSLYTLWNSGRVGMDGLLVEINLLKRQDLFSMALNLLKNARDTLNLRFQLNSDGYENFVFCLAHKSFAAKLARDMIDINTFCPKRKSLMQLGIEIDKLFVMSELGDVTSFILDQKTTSFLKQHARSINYIHITDQYSNIKGDDLSPAQRLASPKRIATFSFALVQNPIDRAEIMLFALNLLDRLRRFKLARDSKQRSDKNRQKITDILQKTEFFQRQEAAQAKKEELRRLEKERIYNEDDPEKQRRWERKEAKREQKKNKMRVKQLKVKAM